MSEQEKKIAQRASGPGKPFTQLGDAERFREQHQGKVLYCADAKEWLIYTGERWRRDRGEQVHRFAQETARKIIEEAELEGADREEITRHWKKACSRSGLKAMLDIASHFEGIVVHSDQLDADPMLLNCRNGTLDLRTFELRPHNQHNLLTRITAAPYNPAAQCPRFMAFLNRIVGGDGDLLGFLQTIAGYLLTGATTEQALLVWHGPGANGKSTLMELLRELLGDYARNTTVSSLLHSTTSTIRNDLARLQGVRMVTASEVGMGKRLDEPLVKQLSGGDMVTARFLHREFTEFKPEAKLIIGANHKPEIRGVDHGIWRRIILVPFNVIIPPGEIDKNLPEKLREELPGVLAWAVEGCRRWQSEGLIIPESIRAATSEYRSEMDVVGCFISDCCTLGADCRVPLGNLFDAFRIWCGRNCVDLMGKKTFGQLMRQKGFNQVKSDSVRSWVGIGLREEAV